MVTTRVRAYPTASFWSRQSKPRPSITESASTASPPAQHLVSITSMSGPEHLTSPTQRPCEMEEAASSSSQLAAPRTPQGPTRDTHDTGEAVDRDSASILTHALELPARDASESMEVVHPDSVRTSQHPTGDGDHTEEAANLSSAQGASESECDMILYAARAPRDPPHDAPNSQEAANPELKSGAVHTFQETQIANVALERPKLVGHACDVGRETGVPSEATGAPASPLAVSAAPSNEAPTPMQHMQPKSLHPESTASAPNDSKSLDLDEHQAAENSSHAQTAEVPCAMGQAVTSRCCSPETSQEAVPTAAPPTPDPASAPHSQAIADPVTVSDHAHQQSDITGPAPEQCTENTHSPKPSCNVHKLGESNENPILLDDSTAGSRFDPIEVPDDPVPCMRKRKRADEQNPYELRRQPPAPSRQPYVSWAEVDQRCLEE